jgi:hypothetical protein
MFLPRFVSLIDTIDPFVMQFELLTVELEVRTPFNLYFNAELYCSHYV